MTQPNHSEPDGAALAVTGDGGAAVSVRIGPIGQGAPVLLIHGFGSSARANWVATGWLAQLARAGRTAVTVDIRGHGLSARSHHAQDYSLPIVLRDLVAVLEALPAVLGPVPTVDLIGYSMGGRLAGELIAAAAGAPGAQPWPDGLPVIGRAVIGGYDGRPLLQDVDLAEFRAELGGARGPDSPGRRMARMVLAGRGADLSALSAFVEGMAADPTWLPATSVSVPTLVVAGDRDRITDATQAWAAGLPDGRHLLLPGRDHVSAVPSAAFRTAAVEFLAR
ncbi:Lysophospholipase, alpha-beta hydrolase superfamily [Nakamurella panacisegetis]|uniref:Lysophospholipase, alpha-beta hydrolase superfamily n=1 Tax=Nakamurella panacisegetis TaxID=1090615 RepID=A0A1H0IVM7_9ACTN|nr:alpha/beta fold hydrolase [Nakamurella panacisegetis]SDO35475.1 Lysophospholipase, alpha-beta hydrolase superfamily [Nakamurella panacisegetis]